MISSANIEARLEDVEKKQVETLGSLRLRDGSNQIILVPTPTTDPNDPLNWSRGYRYYIAGLVCAAIFFCNFLAAGPTVAIAEIAIEFDGVPLSDADFVSKISHVSYFFTTTALLQGMGTLLWMPLIIRFGRRPAYVVSFAMFTASAAWAGGSTSYGGEIAARIVMGFASGAAEVLAPLTIADVFFLHERGTVMALYTCALSAGVSGGIIVAGLITMSNDWRMIYWVSLSLIATATILVFLTFPETAYKRDPLLHDTRNASVVSEVVKKEGDTQREQLHPQQKKSFSQSLQIFTGIYTTEPFLKLFLRPVALLVLPPVFWATLVMSVTIGFLVAVTSNFASAFDTAYGFDPWQSGLCFFAAIIGSLIGIFCGGQVSDKVADLFTRRNGGVREPEMRLPAIAISVVTAPLGLLLYGIGIEKGLHWICPTIGLGLLSFSIVQATNVSLVYTIDSYRPVAGEIVVTQMAFKSAFGFLLSFYTNPWIAISGYISAFGAMAGISGGVLLCTLLFWLKGHAIRHATWKWPLVKSLAHWDEDREVGE